MLEALKALSVFFAENSLRTRRNLRGDIERRSLAINEEFAQIFKQVKEVKSLCKTDFDFQTTQENQPMILCLENTYFTMTRYELLTALFFSAVKSLIHCNRTVSLFIFLGGGGALDELPICLGSDISWMLHLPSCCCNCDSMLSRSWKVFMKMSRQWANVAKKWPID